MHGGEETYCGWSSLRPQPVIRVRCRDECLHDDDPSRGDVKTADIPHRRSWKQDLGPYLEVHRRRSLGQIASVVLPYLGVWVFAWIVQPSPWLAIGLGLVATVFLTRMYSLFHDLTHNSMFDSRTAN